MRILLTLFALLAAAIPARAAPLDAVARDYVRLVLEVGEHEPGYVDAYYGPAEWQAAAKAKRRPLPALAREADRLLLAAQSAAYPSDPLERKRQRFLAAHLKAVAARIRFIRGERLPFADEAEALFGVRPELKPLPSYDAALAEIERLLPGEGLLDARYEALRSRFVVPKDRIDAVVRAATAECRARTLKAIPLPEQERFTLELVTDRPWSGYNWYKGGATSLIQINTDLPFAIDRAVDLGCHEGYPGHHVYNLLLEQRLTRERGWVEFSVYPLYSPMSLIAEGSANHGIVLAFPGEEKTRFEAQALYPLAGLDAADASRYEAVRRAADALTGAANTIAADYLAGRIDRARAVALMRRYLLYSEARAQQRVKFVETYRSYIINYGIGRDMVAAHIERAGTDQASRWKAMATLLSEPTLPGDLAR
jgi:hypothetical protein